MHAFYPQPGVCTPPGCSPLHGTPPPTAAAALTRRERAPRAASSPAARSPDAAGRSAGQRSRHGRCSDPLGRSAGRQSPVGCSGRAGTPGGHRPTSSLAGAGQTQCKGGAMGHKLLWEHVGKEIYKNTRGKEKRPNNIFQHEEKNTDCFYCKFRYVNNFIKYIYFFTLCIHTYCFKCVIFPFLFNL